MYGKRKYGRLNKQVPVIDFSAIPTFVCSHCKRVKQLTSKTVVLSATTGNSVFLTDKICEECGVLLKSWLK